MKSTTARKLTHAPAGPNEDKKLTVWLQEQARKLTDLTAKGQRLKLDFVANARAKGNILLGVKKRLENTQLRFDEWVEQSTDIGYSTALLWMDVAQNFAKVKARFADSNPLELTVRQVRDAIRDERQTQGKGKPRSGKHKTASSHILPMQQAKIEGGNSTELEGDQRCNVPPTGQPKWEREVAKAEAEAKALATTRQADTKPINQHAKVHDTLSAISKQVSELTIPTDVTTKQRKALNALLHRIIDKASSLLLEGSAK